LSEKYSYSNIIGKSEVMRKVFEMIRLAAPSRSNILISGESGTGKELVAKAIHHASPRGRNAFVTVNSGSLPPELLESSLFGHVKGAFTGAIASKRGLFEVADGGSIFLDEIGNINLETQAKLLRVIQEKEFMRLGATDTIRVDVRIIAASNAELTKLVREGTFREDLFYRLNVVRLSIPPLRERRDEIPAFVNHFVARAAEEFKKGHLRVADETMERLLLYRWPGNVRQLQNEIRRMVALAEPESALLPDAISEEILGALPIFRPQPPAGSEIAVGLHDQLSPTLARIEREMIKAALRTHDGKVDAAAKALGISRKGLYLKRQRLGL
jgi:two-component system response regulator PilR (NtrC family)